MNRLHDLTLFLQSIANITGIQDTLSLAFSKAPLLLQMCQQMCQQQHHRTLVTCAPVASTSSAPEKRDERAMRCTRAAGSTGAAPAAAALPARARACASRRLRHATRPVRSARPPSLNGPPAWPAHARRRHASGLRGAQRCPVRCLPDELATDSA